MERVIEETATVVGVADGFVWVEAERRSGCSHCGRAEQCDTGTLAKLFRPSRVRLRLRDSLGLSPGERVRIAVEGGTLIRASLTAYMLPLVMLVVAAGIATALRLSEGLVALLGIGGLGIGLWLGGRLTGGGTGRERYGSRLLGRATATTAVRFDPAVGTGQARH